MSQRVTRSTARQSAPAPAPAPSPFPSPPPAIAANQNTHTQDDSSQPATPTTTTVTATRKRKALEHTNPAQQSPQHSPLLDTPPPRRSLKRSRLDTSHTLPPPPLHPPTRSTRPKGRTNPPAAMSSAGYELAPFPHAARAADEKSPSNEQADQVSAATLAAPTTKKKQRQKPRKTKSSSGRSTLPPALLTYTSADPAAAAADAAPSSWRRRKAPKPDEDVVMQDAADDDPNPPSTAGGESGEPRYALEEDDDGEGDEGDDDDDAEDNPSSHRMLARHGGLAMSSTLRALSGIMSGAGSRLRGILENLKQKDASVQLIALQELSELLLVSNEDNLAGHFNPDAFVRELVKLMQADEFGEENSEMMLLACRCLANLIEALPVSAASVVYGGAVPVLCQKLLEIHYIDLAEQALSTLEKISVEFPSVIVKEGGLTACLTYLDFFAMSTQRTAVTTAANCCNRIPEESFPVVRDVMPILLNVLNSSDQKVLEQGCLCVSRMVESFKHHDTKLEQLISADMLRSILRLLIPGTTNLISANIHTQFLRLLSTVARASPRRSAELFQMNVVDTLYQILTGVSPPSGTEDIATKIDSVVIMQALIHRPRDQIFETLNVICELLPNVQGDMLDLDDVFDVGSLRSMHPPTSDRSRASANAEKVKLLKDCRDDVKRFATILFPTLTDAYSSTVNLNVRQKVLSAQLKMLSNLDTDILEDALRSVPYASFLAAILSQQDHATLVTYALQAAELLMRRLEPIYRYQFYREGVVSEISKLAGRSCERFDVNAAKLSEKLPVTGPAHRRTASSSSDGSSDGADGEPDEDEEHDEEHTDEDDGEDHDEDMQNQDDENGSEPDSSSSEDQSGKMPTMDDMITIQARQFLDNHEHDASKPMNKRAAATLEQLKTLAQNIRRHYVEGATAKPTTLFSRLAEYFDGGDVLESVTSYELLTSNVVQILLDVFSEGQGDAATAARTEFLEAFMSPSTQTKQRTSVSNSPATPFGTLVRKLQDLLSRAEHFEVITASPTPQENGRGSTAAMLAKQLRVKLVADEDPSVPVQYRDLVVSIQAIATFKALDDYLRPRMSIPSHIKGMGGREMSREMANAMAAYAASYMSRDESGRRMAMTSFAPTPGDLQRAIPKRGSRPKHSTTATATATATSTAATGPPQPETSSPAPVKKESTRKSTRKKEDKKAAVPPPPPPPPPPAEEVEEHLECADEARITDDDGALDGEHLDAIVDDLDDEMDSDAPEPDPVNMEVAATGKVTARREDGTRIATPLGGAPVAKIASSSRTTAEMAMALSTNTAAVHALSYAAAMQAAPRDWHLEFSVNGQPVTLETTIYRAVHFNQGQPGEVSSRNIWQAVHTINFKKAKGPAPTESSLTVPPQSSSTAPSGLPVSLDKNPTTSAILRLLSILHELNSNIGDVFADHAAHRTLTPEPLSQFVNTKLTAKLNRQLEEPLVVASNCLPSWSEDLARLYPFLFPFETRHLFLQSTSFGYNRSMKRWEGIQDGSGTAATTRHRHRDPAPFLGRLQKQKVRISRTRMLESATKVMDMYGSSASVLEIEYFDEVGTGLGPTLEFFSNVSKEYSKKSAKLWRENETSDADEYAIGQSGLFPAPMSAEMVSGENGAKKLHLFKMLGKFVARSMLDSRIIDVAFNPTFFRIGFAEVGATSNLSLEAVRSVDADLASSLKVVRHFALARKRIDDDTRASPAAKAAAMQAVRIDGVALEDLALDFTLPGYPNILLCADGDKVAVTMDNVGQYVDAVVDMTLGSGVRAQIQAFKDGFSLVFPYQALKAFTPAELVMLFGRGEEDWSLETLMDSVKADHGFNMDSKSVRNLLLVMSELDAKGRRDFLQFVSGSPRLPIGGFKSLTPMFTVVCKPSEAPYSSDDYLPSVMTCVNYLKLPDYSSLETMRARLGVAIAEGQGAFHLS